MHAGLHTPNMCLSCQLQASTMAQGLCPPLACSPKYLACLSVHLSVTHSLRQVIYVPGIYAAGEPPRLTILTATPFFTTLLCTTLPPPPLLLQALATWVRSCR